MNILFLCRRFYPHIGGVEKHVMEISKRLVAMGHNVTVVTEASSAVIPADGRTKGGRLLDRGGGIQKREAKDMDSWFPPSHKASGGNSAARNDNIDGIEIIRIQVGKENKLKKFRIWKELWSLRETIKNADVVHCHDVFFWYLPFRFLYPRKSVYTTFHGYESYPISKKAIIIRKLSEKLSLGNICIGDFIPKWYGTHPTYISYGGVDSSKLKVKSVRQVFDQTQTLSKVERAQEANSKLKKESALFFGRLDEQTGSLEYTKAVQLIKKKYPKFEFLVVGDGSQRKQIEKITKVIGFQENPERYFQQYRFAFVSRYLSILEAFAAKRLVFAAYDNPVKEDYLRLAPYASFIVIADKPEDIAEKFNYFLKHPEEEKKRIENAYKWVTKQTWEEMVKLYTRLWNENSSRHR